MCFIGNVALSMMLEPSMLAPVLCQPSLPLGDPAGIQLARDEVAAVRARLEREDLTVLAYREPTLAARDEIPAFFVRRLTPGTGASP